MKIKKFLSLCALISLFMAGCGGSGENHVPIVDKDEVLYQATLPDGTMMLISLGQFGNDQWLGSFSMAASSGTYADQAGMIEGSVSGGTINASAESMNGDKFTLTGTVSGDGFQLTRSDLPGKTLVFSRVDTAGVKTRGPSVTFSLYSEPPENHGAVKFYGDVTFSTTPYESGQGYAFYRGTCNSNNGYTGPVTLSTYGDGQMIVVIEVGPNNELGFALPNYTVDKVKTAKVQAKVAIDFIKPNGTFNDHFDARFAAYARPPL